MCPGGYVLGVSVQGVNVQGVSVQGGVSLQEYVWRSKCPGGYMSVGGRGGCPVTTEVDNKGQVEVF